MTVVGFGSITTPVTVSVLSQPVATLYDVPPDVTGSMTPGGSPLTVAMGTVPGQNALVTFSGAQGRRIALGMSNVTIGTSTCCSARVSITSPDNSTLVYATARRPERRLPRHEGAADDRDVHDPGRPQGADLGSMKLKLHDVPADLTGTIAIDGGPVSLTLAPTPGQKPTLTFNGTAAQRVSLRLSNVAIGNTSCGGARISMLKPDGTTVVPPILVGTFSATITATLPLTGAYSIVEGCPLPRRPTARTVRSVRLRRARTAAASGV